MPAAALGLGLIEVAAADHAAPGRHAARVPDGRVPRPRPPSHHSDLAAIVTPDAPWVLRIHYALDVSQKTVMDGFSTSFQRNYPKEKVAQLLPKLDSLAPAIPDVKVGQTLVLAYRPGTGTTVGMEGGAQITVEGKDFAEAMLGTWIGRKPIQDALKKNLLGL